MATKRTKKPDFTYNEMLTLANTVKMYWKSINESFNSSLNNEKKNRCWGMVAAPVNAVGKSTRSVLELKNKWKHLKSAARAAKAAQRAERNGTGVDPQTIPHLSEIDEIIISFVAESTYKGIAGGRDINAERRAIEQRSKPATSSAPAASKPTAAGSRMEAKPAAAGCSREMAATPISSCTVSAKRLATSRRSAAETASKPSETRLLGPDDESPPPSPAAPDGYHPSNEIMDLGDISDEQSSEGHRSPVPSPIPPILVPPPLPPRATPTPSRAVRPTPYPSAGPSRRRRNRSTQFQQDVVDSGQAHLNAFNAINETLRKLVRVVRVQTEGVANLQAGIRGVNEALQDIYHFVRGRFGNYDTDSTE